MTVVVRVSSTVEPETVAAVTLLLTPPVVTAKAEVAAVVADKASLKVSITFVPVVFVAAEVNVGAIPSTSILKVSLELEKYCG